MVKINCDIGEGFGIYEFGHDADLMGLIDMANVACGFHAGDPVTMRRTVALARAHDVCVGAHPSFPDREGFGRRVIEMSDDELLASLIYQVSALRGFADLEAVKLSYLKPHGALFGLAATNIATAQVIAHAADAFDLPLVGLPGTAHERVWGQRAPGFIAEFYADLDYAPDGTVIVTREHGEVDVDAAVDRAVEAATTGRVVALSGEELRLRVDSICVHSDTPGVVALTTQLRRALNAPGGETAKFEETA